MNEPVLHTDAQASPRRLPLIHLGMPKTATTFLQSFVFALHSEVKYLGKFEGEKHFCSPAMQQAVRCLRQPTHPKLRSHYGNSRREIERQQLPGKLTVFSDEAFTFGSRSIKAEQAKRFRDFFGDCRILLTIREPLSLMETLYFQELRGFNYNKSIYLRFLKPFGHPPRYFSLEEWLELVWSFPHHGAFSHLNVADTVEAYADVFGAENVMVGVYEELKRDNLAFVRRLSEDIGVDPDESVRLCENANRKKNARWLEGHVERLKQFNDSRLLYWKYRLLKSRRQFKEFLGTLGPNEIVDSPTARAEFSPEWKERILAIGREQFSQLDERWNLNLSEYGYPVSNDCGASHLPQNPSGGAKAA